MGTGMVFAEADQPSLRRANRIASNNNGDSAANIIGSLADHDHRNMDAPPASSSEANRMTISAREADIVGGDHDDRSLTTQCGDDELLLEVNYRTGFLGSANDFFKVDLVGNETLIHVSDITETGDFVQEVCVPQRNPCLVIWGDNTDLSFTSIWAVLDGTINDVIFFPFRDFLSPTLLSNCENPCQDNDVALVIAASGVGSGDVPSFQLTENGQVRSDLSNDNVDNGVFRYECVPGDSCYRATFNTAVEGTTFFGQIFASFAGQTVLQENGIATTESSPSFGSSCETTNCPNGQSNLNIILNTDQSPSETSFRVVGSDITIAFPSDFGFGDDLKQFEYNECVPSNDCYSFFIFDSGGDGICCSRGNGNIAASFDGEEVFSASSFGSEAASDLFGMGCSNGPTTTAATTTIASRTTTAAATTTTTVDDSVTGRLNDRGGDPPTEHIPLGLCEGDCDNDDQCEEGLFCFQRDPDHPVPGCTGNLGSRTDFCIWNKYKDGGTGPTTTATSGTTTTTVNDSITGQLRDRGADPPSNHIPLGLCEGDCDNDEQCEEGLFCLQRGKNDPVPGCTGDSREFGSRTDFCIWNKYKK